MMKEDRKMMIKKIKKIKLHSNYNFFVNFAEPFNLSNVIKT